eukprot:353578-Chlamydomonas_euryale.AAC.5
MTPRHLRSVRPMQGCAMTSVHTQPQWRSSQVGPIHTVHTWSRCCPNSPSQPPTVLPPPYPKHPLGSGPPSLCLWTAPPKPLLEGRLSPPSHTKSYPHAM